MFFCKLFVCLLTTLICVTHGCNNITDWTYQTFLDQNNNVFAKWTSNKEDITIELTGKTKGWVAIGFSPSSGMPGADIVMGWVQNGQGILQDRHGQPNQNGFPPLDKNQDVELLSSSENGTHTTLCFRRKLNTCDEEDLPITESTMKIIWAFNPNDPSDPSKPEYHGPNNRGQISQFMLGKTYQRPPMDDVKVWDMKVDQVALPSNKSTYYWCQIFSVPNVTEKQHLIGFEPLIQKENADLVHHFTIYECTGKNINQEIQNTSDPFKGSECFTEESPPASFHCQKTLIVWTVGLKGQFFPTNVGLPFGYYDGRIVYYMADVHYTNANLKKGVTDSSGLRFYYTSKLKRFDASQIMVGYYLHQPFEIIPPGQESWKVVAHCAPECLKESFNESKIQVFGALVHAHLAATKIVLRHFRGNVELPPIIENNHYQFNYQETVLFSDVEVLTSDVLTVECTHNTSTRKQVTLGGQPTTDEMCVVFILYYPRMNFSRCYSNLPLEDIQQITKIQEFWPLKSAHEERRIKNPPSLQNMTLRNYLKNYNFTQTQLDTLRQKELKGNKTPVCLTDDGISQSKDLKNINYPENFKPYIWEDNCTKKKSK